MGRVVANWLGLALFCTVLGAGCSSCDCHVPCAETPLVVALPEEMAPGAWSFELEVEGGRRFECETTIPMEQEAFASCSDPDLDLRLVVDEAVGEAFPSFVFKFRPARVKLVALNEGQVVAKKTVWPDYKMVYPDSPECAGEECATVHVEF